MYWGVFTIFLTGLKYGDRISNSFHNLAWGFGASKKTEIKFIRFPLIIRGWVIGCQSAWMWAVLGALLGDFAGNTWGLGTFLIGSISQGDPNKVWTIALLCLFMSSAGLLIIRKIANKLKLYGSYDPLDISVANVPKELRLNNFF